MKKSGQVRNLGMIWFLANVVFGVYLLNWGLNFVALSFITESINKWIIVIGGVLLIINGVMSMTKRTPAYPPHYR